MVWGNRLRGWVHLYVTEVPCLSCLGAMVQFTRRFPRVELRVAYPGSEKVGASQGALGLPRWPPPAFRLKRGDASAAGRRSMAFRR